jgi:dienelactone hydrolase
MEAIMLRLRIATLFFASLAALACSGQQGMAGQRVVSLTAADGTSLKGTYFSSTKPGPGVLLLHQCNQQRKLWDVLGERLAAEGINVLTIDYRGFGESGGTPHDKLSPEDENKIETEKWPGDIEMAYQYLLAQPGVTRDRIGVGGASCGVNMAIKLARKHAEVKSLVLLAGPTDREGRLFLQSSKNLPIFTSAANDDIFGNQALLMQWLFSVSTNPASRFAHYAKGGHAAEMFTVDTDLPDIIAKWFLATLANHPELAPKTNGTAFEPQVVHNLELIDQPGGQGAKQVAETLTAGHEHGAGAVMLPEEIVNLLGYEHIQMGDIKGAVEILRLNVMEYPNSANAYDSLSDAYLADGQKEVALQNAKKAMELLANDTVDTEQRRNAIRDSAEQKIKQLAPAHP